MTEQLSVVIPVYNNAPTLVELHARLTKVLQQITDRYELLFIDDCGHDHAAEILQHLAVWDERVAVLRLTHNVGQNRAVLVGLAHARGNVIIVMDADLQDPPEAIPLLLPKLTDDVAAVFAGRRGHYEARGRLISSWIFKHTLYLLSGCRLPVDAGLFVAMRRNMRSQLLSFDVSQPYVVGLMAQTRLRLCSIPVVREANNERESGYTTRKRIALARNALRQMLPLKRPVSRTQSVQAPVLIREYVGARFKKPIGEPALV